MGKTPFNMAIGFVYLALAAWIFLDVVEMKFAPVHDRALWYMSSVLLFIAQMALSGFYIGKALEGTKP